MKLKEMLKENGCYATFDNMGFGAEKVLSGLTEEASEQYSKYQWFDGKFIVHAGPTPDMLEAGFPWEEWYKDPNTGSYEHHVLYLKKTDKCDMTFDGTNLPPEDGHPEPTKGHFWYLYNDEDARLIYAR